MKYWVNVPYSEDLQPVEAMSIIVVDSVLIFMNHNKQIVAAFNEWNDVMDETTINL